MHTTESQGLKASATVTSYPTRREVDDRGSSKRGEGNHDSNIDEVKDSGKRGDAAHETASKEVDKKGVGVEGPPASASPSRRSQGVSGVLKQQR